MNQDKIRLTGMQFYGYHGAIHAEGELGQRFEVDVEIALDLSIAGASDRLQDTLNYASVFESARSIIEGPRAQLIESVASRIAQQVLADNPKAAAVVVRLRKPEAPIPGIFASVEVEIERRQS